MGLDTRSIEKRDEAEKVYHDKKFGGKTTKDFYAYGFTGVIFESMVKKIGNVEDKKVLEYGCGIGWFTKMLANKGAEVWAFDISSEAVALTRSRTQGLLLKHSVHVDQMSGEKLEYDDNMFDLVIGSAILHHLDLQTSVREIARVLKKGGKAYFMEPLGHNPVLNLFRKLTPDRRSRDEKPLRFEDIAIFKENFGRIEHEEYYLTAMMASFWHLLGLNGLMLKTRDTLVRLDNVLMNAIPGLKKHCWYSIITMEK